VHECEEGGGCGREWFAQRGVADRGFPFKFGRQLSAADEHKACIQLTTEMLCKHQTKAAETTGDQVDAAGCEAFLLWKAGEIEIVERFDVALALAVGDGGVVGLGADLGENESR
jgi:hypothetical protein